MTDESQEPDRSTSPLDYLTNQNDAVKALSRALEATDPGWRFTLQAIVDEMNAEAEADKANHPEPATAESVPSTPTTGSMRPPGGYTPPGSTPPPSSNQPG